MAAKAIRVIDVSEFTGPISRGWWVRQRRRHSIRGAVIQCWGGGHVAGHRNAFFHQQLQGALRAGLKVASYCWPPADSEKALKYIGNDLNHLAFFALDIEAGAAVRRAHVRTIHARGIEPVIYVSPAGWSSIMRNTRSYSDLKLWLARYPRSLSPSAPVRWETSMGRAFGSSRVGGWTTVIGWQFRGTTDMAGEQADLNVFHASAFERDEDRRQTMNVREIQIRVAGYAADRPARAYVKVDGIDGPQTRAAVMRFQRGYGLAVDGAVGPQTTAALKRLDASDGSTKHFAWSEFESKDGRGLAGGKETPRKAKENVRRLMWKLEALRHKAGDRPVTINSGFRSVAHNRAVGGATNSQHLYGIAADITVAGRSVRRVSELAKTCGLSGIKAYSGHVHVDSRVEYSYGHSRYWWAN